MSPEQLADWLQSEVTTEFFKDVKISLQNLKEIPRFRLIEKVGDRTIPMTADSCALKNAYNEGRIEAMQELLDSRESLIELHKEAKEDEN